MDDPNDLPGVLIDFASHRLRLLPGRAIWWRATRTLIVADIHFGKAATFRAFHVPVPAGTTAADLARLESLIARTRAERLLVLGDLIHAKLGREDAMLSAVSEWRRKRPGLTVSLVRGNHDRSAGDPPAEWGVDVVDGDLREAGLRFTHHPEPDPSVPTLAGHVHPATTLIDFDKSGVRVPCFVVDPMQIVLPAFGRFTGGATVERFADRKCYAIGANRVVCTERVEWARARPAGAPAWR